MNIHLITLSVLIFYYSGKVQCTEFVTVWAPRFTQQGEIYNVLFMPTKLQKDTEIALQYRKINVTCLLNNDKLQSIEYPNSRSFGDVSSQDLFVTLLRNQTNGKAICATQKLNIPTVRREFYIFIQHDKPIYKPSDKIKARIIVVDRNLIPYQMTNINVTIHDPLNRIIHEYDDLEGQNIGVFEIEYELTEFAILGDWKIRAEVDKISRYAVSKKIPLQKYVLPLFDVNIDLSERHMLRSSDLTIYFNGKYSFGEFVAGNAKLTIQNAGNGQVYKTQEFKNIKDIQRVTYNIYTDLTVKEIPDSVDYIKLEAAVVFEEPESGLKFNKTVPFYIHGDMNHKIVAVHPEKYLPGFPFVIKASIYDWKNNKIEKHFERVTFVTLFRKTNGDIKSVVTPRFLKDGVATYEIIPELDYEEFKLEAQFVNSRTYKRSIPKGKVSVGINGLQIGFLPSKPKIDETVKVFIKSNINMEQIIMVISTKKKNIKTQQVSCFKKTTCQFEIKITEQMMPYSTITVYHVVDKLHIYQGSANIETDELGANQLSFTLSETQVRAKDTLTIKFNARKESKVYILAFDKRLTFLSTENNDVSREDIRATQADYDKENNIMIFDISNSKLWHPCTQTELDRVEKSRKFIGQQSGNILRPYDLDEDEFDPIDNEIINDDEESPVDPAILRDNFPETWIFETLKMRTKQTRDIVYTVPDAMTTWLISAFSTVNGHRLAMAPTQELTVKNDFFIKMNLPYSIKFKEVLRLDILVYNYVESGETLNVIVKLENLQKRVSSNALVREFEFVEYTNVNNECTGKYNTNSKSSKSVVVPNMSVKKVSFYIRSNPKDNDFEKKIHKKIVLQARANAKGVDQDYEDAVRRELLVEPVGVDTYNVFSEYYKLYRNSTSGIFEFGDIISYNITDSRKYPISNVVITGDYLTNMMGLNSRFDFFPSYCLEQRTSRFKGNVEYYRYRLSREVNPSTEQFSSYYQKILNEGMNRVWNYHNNVGYRAYFAEAFITALDLGVIHKNSKSLEIVTDVLNYLKSSARTDGSFTCPSFPFGRSDGTITHYYRDTSYVLIPFLKYQKLMNNNSLYNDVVNNGFKYLDKNKFLDIGSDGLSVGAYAYALNGDNETALYILKKLEKTGLQYVDNQKCFRINKSNHYCSLIITVYGALAYLELNEMNEAQPFVYWLLKDYEINRFYSNTFDHAIATEVIAKMAIYLKISDTNLTVNISNEFEFFESFKITKSNSNTPFYITFPDYSRIITANVTGSGFCTITTVFESKVYVDRVSPLFSVSIDINNHQRSSYNEIMIRVCFKYNIKDKILPNVINEVDLPSGYQFIEVTNWREINTDLKLYQLKRDKTRILLYYDEVSLEKSKINKYCADIKIRKIYDVLNLQAAGVKVYDYGDKDNIAIEFFKLPPSSC